MEVQDSKIVELVEVEVQHSKIVELWWKYKSKSYEL